MTFAVQYVHEGLGGRVLLEGVMNEEAQVELERVRAELAGPLVFDFARVKAVNSAGVRVWIDFLRSIVTKQAISMARCPPEVVVQINMIPSFSSGAVIESVLGYFSCEQCRYRVARQFGPRDVTLAADRDPCPRCRAQMHFEESPEEYFYFWKRKS